MTHTITADIYVRWRVPGLEDLEGGTMRCEIEYDYVPGYPATGPSYASGGEPGAGAEVSFIHAKLLDWSDLGFEPLDEQVEDWAETWLNDDGYDAACREAEEAGGPDPDAAYERQRDDAAERWRDE